MMQKPLRVVIAGAGVGGLAAAHELVHRLGDRVHVRLLEAAHELRPQLGAGFSLSGGLQCLRQIPALSDELSKISSTPKLFRTVQEDGTLLASFPAKDLVGDPPALAQFMRDELQLTLAKTLPDGLVECGQRVVSVDKENRMLHTEKESDIPFDLLIGADGIKSHIRGEHFDKEWDREYSGLSMYYGVISNDEVKKHGDFRFQEGAITETVGKGNLQLSFQCGPSRDWTFAYAYRCAEPPADDEWATTDEALREKMSEITKFSSRAMHFGIYHTPPRSVSWVNDRIVLLGDAAHATTPFMGQGANQAIQDAACLGRLLSEDLTQIDAALQEFYKIREPVTSRIIKNSKFAGQLRTADSFMERTLRSIAYRIMFARDGALFKRIYQAETKPVI
ncbi:Kynurenine 3-monooxygenase [Hondaea fermentalgiana]|uniref:Kynurenine 3-monooxygenase n=1 Tax=Hondaea fermentalgiana TaxID=2315210 RepID=A0A2R5GJ36_9STRA|nr:Kynurenine 3-monooxygenase [Hondaea fermentalgiana]|eukprot:GBG27874.1 Kynurenine 3-monooxygenase [Hondaea fermentalgiana]